MNATITESKKRFYNKSLWTLLWFSLFLPILLKLLVDVPSVAVDYICNSYAPFYPTATTAGLVAMQITVVIADILRAGFIGCVLCVLLYVIDKNVGKVRSCVMIGIAIVCPAIVSFVGVSMTSLCVSTGLSRQTIYEFKATLPEIKTAAMIEFALYMVLIVGAVLCLLLRKNRANANEREEQTSNSFFPSSSIFKTVTIAIVFSGAVSLTEKILETVVDLKNYQITDSFEAIVSFLVLAYLYLVISLFAMLCFAAIICRRMDKKWKKYGEDRA